MGNLRRLLAAGAALLVAGWLPLVGSAPAAAQSGSPLVTESFTGATADPRFEGFGSACLTGAPPGATPGPGDHPLGSCSAARTGPVPPEDAAPFGYLQLTDASNDQAGAVLFNQPLPANEGVEVSFEQWQYGSTTPATPADGISFFLVDGAGGLTAPGAFGGSLGYAQKLPDDNPANPFLPGVDNGYLGIGLDTLGNYFGDWEHRGNGCERRSPAGTAFRVPAPGPNMVTVRGPGNGTDGYCFLTATTSNLTTTGPWPSTLPGQLQGPLTDLPPGVTPAQAQALLEPSRRTVTVRVTPAPDPRVTVDVDFNDGTGPHRVLDFAAPQPIPPTYKLGFAASTGGFTDVHLIRNVRVGSILQLPQLNLVKQVVIDPPLPSVIGVGTQVPYEFVVTNSGGTPISQLVVNDPNFTGIECPTTTLAPNETTVCTGTYTVTQADVDRGVVVNTATASGSSSAGPVTSPESQATLPLGSGTPGLSLTKVADPTTVSAAGQQVTYQYTATNTGTVTLTGLDVVDTDFTGTGTPPAITCPSTTLAPGVQVTCTGTYTVTQADLDAGTTISDTATATGTAPDGTSTTSPPSTATVDIATAPGLALVKSVDPTAVTTAGQALTYSFLVTNNGNVTLDGVAIDETAFSGTGTPPVITCPVTTLAPGAQTTCTAGYTVTQADIDAGSIGDTATATGTTPGGTATTSPPSSAVVDVVTTATLSLAKIADPATVTAAGQQVSYRLLVTNTGTVTVDNLTVADSAFSGSGTPPVITCPVTTLAPEAQTTCTASYTVTQADLDAGGVTNTATASGTTPDGTTIASPPATATVTVDAAPSLALVKSADPPTVSAPGQVVTYRFSVTNNGNVTVDNLTIDDTQTGTGTVSPIGCPATTLAPLETTTCTATYTVTQADLDAGTISDTATASGTDPAGAGVTSPPSSAVVSVSPGPSLSLTKFVAPSTVSAAGQQVSYEYTVTNTGDAGITGLVVTDTAFSGTGTAPVITCPVTALAPGAQTTCTGTYTVTQADLDAGGVTNTAVATGTAGETTVTSPPSTATLDADSLPSLALVKSARPGTVAAAGQAVTYDFLVTNNGNTTLTGITVSETAFTGTGTPPVIDCPVTTLAPDASTTCTAAYSVTQADIDAGSVTNTATASGTPPVGAAVTSPPSTAIVNADVAAALSLTKVAVPDSVSAAGQRVTYEFVVTNTGTVTVGSLAIVETQFSGTGTPPVAVCPVTSLAPGDQTTCQGAYTVTQSDVDSGSVTNTASATGTAPDGTRVTSPPSTAVVDAVTAASLALVKSADPTAVTAPGQQVTYSFQVTNTGDVTLTALTIHENQFTGTGDLSPTTCPRTELPPGQTTTCTATYSVTQADLDAGSITNTATASATAPDGNPVSAPQSSAVVAAATVAGLSLAKSADPATVTAPGQQVTYSFQVTNTGDVTLTALTIHENQFTGTGDLSPTTCPRTELPPGQTTTCTATYSVTQADLDAGSITNTATATATAPDGNPATSDPATATVTFTGVTRLGLTKTARVIDVNGDRRTDAGDRIEWTLVVTNLGATTLNGIAVSDPAAGPVSCPATRLAPGASMTCTAPPHSVTVADAAAGEVVNTATASATTGAGDPVTSDPARTSVAVSGALPVTGVSLTASLITAGVLAAAGALLLLASVQHIRRDTR